MSERYLVLDPDGTFRWVETDRDSMLETFHEVIDCECIEQVTLPFGFCCLVDESGKIKAKPQRFNPLASWLYPGTAYGDPLVGPVVFVRIGLVDGEYDWCPLFSRDLDRISILTGKEIPK